MPRHAAGCPQDRFLITTLRDERDNGVSLVLVRRVSLVTNIYVGNLAFAATDDDLRSAFEQFGDVSSVNIIMDRETGRSRGFAFVEMSNSDQANEAIENLDGKDIAGRNVRVNEARPREPRGGGGGRGGYRGGRDRN